MFPGMQPIGIDTVNVGQFHPTFTKSRGAKQSISKWDENVWNSILAYSFINIAAASRIICFH